MVIPGFCWVLAHRAKSTQPMNPNLVAKWLGDGTMKSQSLKTTKSERKLIPLKLNFSGGSAFDIFMFAVIW